MKSILNINLNHQAPPAPPVAKIQAVQEPVNTGEFWF